MKRVHALLLTLAVLSVSLGTLPAAERVALVIGNTAYQHARRLPNATLDAVAVEKLVKEAGFQVIAIQDAGVEKVYDGLEQFKKAAAGAQIGLFYYAGHGVEVEGTNYLLPVDAQLDTAAQLRSQAVSLETVLADMKSARLSAKMLILDCCRDNPLSRSWMVTRTTGTGMAAVKDETLPEATMILYAAAPGKPALDGTAGNSPFTAALVQHLGQPGVSAFDAFLAVSDSVAKTTGERQVPWLKFDGAGRTFRLFALRPALPGMPANPLEQGALGKELTYTLPGGVELRLCYIPPGQFQMGPDGDAGRFVSVDQVNVTISQGLWMAKYECTQGQWQALEGANPSIFQGLDFPVEQVSWEDAQRFITELNAKVKLPDGWVWALPTEAQWEYACRAGTTTPFHFGDTLNGNEANCDGAYPYGTAPKGPSLNMTAKVGSYEPNGWGLCDMHGNVYEWCSDWFGNKLLGGRDPTGPATGIDRVYRGGSWNFSARYCLAANRSGNSPTYRISYLGFRPAAVPVGAR